MNPIDPYVSNPGDETQSRKFTRPTVTTIILIMLVVMIIVDIFTSRRRAATHSLSP